MKFHTFVTMTRRQNVTTYCFNTGGGAENTSKSLLQETGWTRSGIWDEKKHICYSRDSNPSLPACSQDTTQLVTVRLLYLLIADIVLLTLNFRNYIGLGTRLRFQAWRGIAALQGVFWAARICHLPTCVLSSSETAYTCRNNWSRPEDRELRPC
jgi:hypothetical protein